LQSLEINEVFIVGLAYDVCVLKTAFSALRFGYLVNIVEDATQALDKTAVPTKIEEEMKVLNQGNPDTFSERLKIIQSY
jgi:nicotinamidase-related amidase